MWICGADALLLSLSSWYCWRISWKYVIRSVWMDKVLDYYPLTADFCMAPNLLLEVDLTWWVPKFNHQSGFPTDWPSSWGVTVHTGILQSLISLSEQQCVIRGSPEGSATGAVHNVLQTRGLWCCASPEGRSSQQRAEARRESLVILLFPKLSRHSNLPVYCFLRLDLR